VPLVVLGEKTLADACPVANEATKVIRQCHQRDREKCLSAGMNDDVTGISSLITLRVLL
jgi:hypothetical protein